MSGDPRTDFFASGGAEASPAAAQDARTAFFASDGQSQTPPSTAPVYDAALFRKRVGRDPEPAELANFKASKGVGWAGDPTQGKFTAGQAALGGIEDATSLATGVAASVPAAGAYLYGLTGAGGTDSLSAARATRNALTYQPRSEAGQAGIQAIGQIASGPGEIAPRVLDVAGYPNAAQTTREVEERIGDVAPLVGEAAAAFPATRAVGKRVFSPIQDPEGAPSAGDIAANTVKNSPQSMGAAAASPRISSTSPQLQQAIVGAAQKTGGAINPDALARHVEADTLPEPMQLTEGQALQDPARISNEQNLRGKHQELSARFNEQNGQLVRNLQAIRDEVGPDVFTTNAVEHGDTLIKAYQDKGAAAEANTAAKYQALRDANNGDFPADPQQLVTNASAALKKEMLSSKAPKDVMSSLQEAADRGSISLDEFETARTRLAQIARSSSDGQERYAAGVVRQEMEKLPISGNAANLKGLADDARNAARTQFQAVEADPAYKAAMSGSVPPDRFVQRFVTGGTRDNVALMKQNLAHDPVAQQTMGVAAVDSLRDAAGIKPDGTGNFTQAGYNKQRVALDPKMKSLISSDQAETVEKLGNVARYTQFQPRGSFVNNSNTFVSAAAQHAGDLAEGAIDRATGLPLASMTRGALAKRSQKAAVRNMLKPGAGLDVLEEKP